jgi:capsular exopolysaccharide synthesis family protein
MLAGNTLKFVEERLKIVSGDLTNIEKEIQQYKTEKGITDLSQQGQLFLQNVGANDQKLADINMQIAVLDQVEKYILSKDKSAGIVPSTLGINDALLSQLLQKLSDAQVQYEHLKQTTAENNPILVSVANEIEQIRPTILENVRNQRAGLEASRSNLNTTNDSYASVLQNIPKKERDLVAISREQAIKNGIYSFLLQKREETALSYASTISDSRVVENAEADEIPVSPKAPIALGGGVLIGFLLGIAYVIFREFLSSKVLFRSEIESAVSAPVVAEITHFKKGEKIITNDTRQSILAEQFRHIRAVSSMYGKSNQKRQILVTSSIAGEGKSFVSSNLAMSLALSGKNVVLVDTDIRNPIVSKVFQLEAEAGLTNFLEGEKNVYEIIRKTESIKLHVIPSGRTALNPTELLLNGKLDELFNYLSDIFDYVIIDSAPVDPVTDAYLLSEYCDTTLFLIRHRYTPKAAIKMFEENYKIKALKNVNIVFNDIKSRGFFRKAYGFGYGFGYDNVYGPSAYGQLKSN